MAKKSGLSSAVDRENGITKTRRVSRAVEKVFSTTKTAFAAVFAGTVFLSGGAFAQSLGDPDSQYTKVQMLSAELAKKPGSVYGQIAIRKYPWSRSTALCNFSRLLDDDGTIKNVTAKHCLESGDHVHDIVVRERLTQNGGPYVVTSDNPRPLRRSRYAVSWGGGIQWNILTISGCLPIVGDDDFSICAHISGRAKVLDGLVAIPITPEQFTRLAAYRNYDTTEGLSGAPVLDTEGRLYGTFFAHLKISRRTLQSGISTPIQYYLTVEPLPPR